MLKSTKRPFTMCVLQLHGRLTTRALKVHLAYDNYNGNLKAEDERKTATAHLLKVKDLMSDPQRSYNGNSPRNR
ncbi:hypothetical protein L596_010024 [Steinernema carpocapsae]|uniref:Uncharacterized protein n=1 Tax=Steinernema carpocapsae TaxID=34508 RepID=A0A4U5PH32_STECR|nr:hypothetical protein L596_010024 [Steinernema carpocapsae]